ncbi:MAG TPA: pyrroline-5-carboxylate reductase [Thermomicrobiales bacterium]|nr:pyrroline-5-carboxylate reductase [Thermomicrobiales bacterium]
MNATTEHLDALRGKRVTFIGTGVMGEAIIAALLDAGLLEPGQITGSEPYAERRDELADRYGVRMVASNAEAVAGADVVMLTIKPQSLNTIFADLSGQLSSEQVVVSIIAGATVERLWHGLDHQRIVRSMPNTPAQIGQGVTVWMPTPAVSDEQNLVVSALLSAMGHAVRVDTEDAVDMATALSGTGPAYIFLVMEALIDAGVHMGFPRRIAEELVLQTMIGSVLFARESGKHPAELRNMVTSPGGTTAAALYQMEKGSLRTVISRAVWAAYQRTVELGQDNPAPVPPPA